METWGQERNQNYQAYQPGHSVAFFTRFKCLMIY